MVPSEFSPIKAHPAGPLRGRSELQVAGYRFAGTLITMFVAWYWVVGTVITMFVAWHRFAGTMITLFAVKFSVGCGFLMTTAMERVKHHGKGQMRVR